MVAVQAAPHAASRPGGQGMGPATGYCQALPSGPPGKGELFPTNVGNN